MLHVLIQPVPRPPRLIHGELGAWLMALAMLDVLVTSMVLSAGGSELNPVACAVIQQGGVLGMIVLKLTGTVTVLAICEYIGRKCPGGGRRVLMLALAVNALAVGMGAMVVGTYTVVLLAAL